MTEPKIALYPIDEQRLINAVDTLVEALRRIDEIDFRRYSGKVNTETKEAMLDVISDIRAAKGHLSEIVVASRRRREDSIRQGRGLF